MENLIGSATNFVGKNFLPQITQICTNYKFQKFNHTNSKVW